VTLTARLVRNPPLILGFALLLLLVVAAILAPALARYPVDEFFNQAGAPPSPQHWMGLNDHAQDVFSQWVYSARYSLSVGFGAAFGSALLSIIIGISAGYAGGRLDNLLTFITNVSLIVPPFPLVYVLVTAAPSTGELRLILLLSLTTWGYGARILRSQTLSLRRRDFIDSAVVIGESAWNAVVREILPFLASLISFVFLNAVFFALLLEFNLEFVGEDVGDVGWGMMLANAHYDAEFLAGYWWTWLFPALGIAATVASIVLINAGLDRLLSTHAER
jgi:peptide/nickel transport system permease protein